MPPAHRVRIPINRTRTCRRWLAKVASPVERLGASFELKIVIRSAAGDGWGEHTTNFQQRVSAIVSLHAVPGTRPHATGCLHRDEDISKRENSRVGEMIYQGARGGFFNDFWEAGGT